MAKQKPREIPKQTPKKKGDGFNKTEKRGTRTTTRPKKGNS